MTTLNCLPPGSEQGCHQSWSRKCGGCCCWWTERRSDHRHRGRRCTWPFWKWLVVGVGREERAWVKDSTKRGRQRENMKHLLRYVFANVWVENQIEVNMKFSVSMLLLKLYSKLLNETSLKTLICSLPVKSVYCLFVSYLISVCEWLWESLSNCLCFCLLQILKLWCYRFIILCDLCKCYLTAFVIVFLFHATVFVSPPFKNWFFFFFVPMLMMPWFNKGRCKGLWEEKRKCIPFFDLLSFKFPKCVSCCMTTL